MSGKEAKRPPYVIREAKASPPPEPMRANKSATAQTGQG
jgi:hypothetical protein